MHEQYLGRLSPDMNVCDVDGQKIGAVVHVYRDELAAALVQAEGSDAGIQSGRTGIMEVKTGPLGLGKHLYIPISAVDVVTEEGIFVATKKDELAEEWSRKPEYLDRLQ